MSAFGGEADMRRSRCNVAVGVCGIVRRQFCVIAGNVLIEHRTLHLVAIATILAAGANQAVPLRKG
jgi:hypothetical protein